MSEGPTVVGGEGDRLTDGSGNQLLPDHRREPSLAGRQAARSLARFGHWLGAGLLILGLLEGFRRGVESIAAGSTTSAWISLVVEVTYTVLAYGLAGWAASILCRLAGALAIAGIERDARLADDLIAEAARGVNALERLALSERRAAEPSNAPDAADGPRARSSIEIDQALRSKRWAEAEALIDEFERSHPDDRSLPDMKGRLESGRESTIQEQMEHLEAARQVNDPARVIELYQGLLPSLEADRRTALARELAKWFLELIHRRLRTGKIQADVVLLATQVAETFGGTTEGASMRAALPTLRRSVGLCARCARPYTGTAEACPECLAGGLGAAARPPADLPPSPSSNGP